MVSSLILLSSKGKLFHSLGAAAAKALSPSVANVLSSNISKYMAACTQSPRAILASLTGVQTEDVSSGDFTFR